MGHKKSIQSYTAVKEKLDDNGTELTNLYFRHGGNFYVFSYRKDGTIKHTLVDAGYLRYKDIMESVLSENHIDIKNIERIIITHRHPDHCGFAYLFAGESGAQILVHNRFRDFAEGRLSREEKSWLGPLDPTAFSRCNIRYLSPSKEAGSIKINGIDFPRLLEPIKIGNSGEINILAVPESKISHTPDQIVVLYSTGQNQDKSAEHSYGDMFFSGDLWLMHGPVFEKNFSSLIFHIKYVLHRMKRMLSGKNRRGISITEEDAAVKEALKEHFSLIRVKPGHGKEFIGSRIIPFGLPSERDLLNRLTYTSDMNRNDVQLQDSTVKMTGMKEQAYANFIREIMLWKEQGYTLNEISEILVRIYREQKGGSTSTAIDRKHRRAMMKATLKRLKNDTNVSGELRQLAELTLPELHKI